MSDLLVTHKNLTAPPKACGQESPAPDAKNPNPKDDCYLLVPLLDSDHLKDNPRPIRFDRQGRRFQLSKFNNNENLTWISNHKNLAEVLEILRMSEALLRVVPTKQNQEGYGIFLVMTQFIVTGRAVFDAWKEAANDSILRTDYELAISLLNIFVYHSDAELSQIFGALNVLRSDGITSQAASERIMWLNDLLGLRASLPKVWGHFVRGVGVEQTQWTEWRKTASEAQAAAMIQILLLCQKMVVDHWQKKNSHFDRVFFLKANEAFEKLVQDPKNNFMVEGDFCLHLEAGLKELWGETKVPLDFKQQCHSALALVPKNPVEAAHESLKVEILGEGGLKRLRNLMKEESQRTGISIDGLQGKGRLEEILRIYDQALVVAPKNGSERVPELNLDAIGLATAMEINVKRQIPTQKEYILSSLALLRRLFDDEGRPLPIRIFWDGQFIELPVRFSRGQAADILYLRETVERMLKVSEQPSDKLLLGLEAGACAAGLAGVAVSEWVDPIAKHESLQFKMGLTSSAVAGGGCFAGIGHIVWPEVATVRNQWKWDALTGTGGTALGAGIYLVIKFLKSSAGNDTKFPVGEFGK